jgi:hypothetical protein
MALSSYLRDKLLDHFLKGTAFTQPTNVYISLHTADPGLAGASEVAGGSYARQLANTKFAAAGSGSKVSNADIEFPLMPVATLTHAGIWDAVSGGNFLSGGALTTPKTTASGDSFRLASGQLSQALT